MRPARHVLGLASHAHGVVGAVGVVDLPVDAGGLGGPAEALGGEVHLLGAQMLLVIGAPGGLMALQPPPTAEVGSDLAAPRGPAGQGHRLLAAARRAEHRLGAGQLASGQRRAQGEVLGRQERAVTVVDRHQVAVGEGVAVVRIGDQERIVLARLVVIVAGAIGQKLHHADEAVVGAPHPRHLVARIVEAVVWRRVGEGVVQEIGAVEVGIAVPGVQQRPEPRRAGVGQVHGHRPGLDLRGVLAGQRQGGQGRGSVCGGGLLGAWLAACNRPGGDRAHQEGRSPRNDRFGGGRHPAEMPEFRRRSGSLQSLRAKERLPRRASKVSRTYWKSRRSSM